MKIVNPVGSVNILPLLRKSKQVLVQPPLYIDNQIQHNPAWIDWCMTVYGYDREEAEYAAHLKSMFAFDGDVLELKLVEILDKAIDNFKPQNKVTMVLRETKWKYPC